MLFPLMCDQEVSEQILSHKQLLYTVVLPGVRSHEMSAVFCWLNLLYAGI
ncbi:hypothetical protein EAKF1_ch4205 [Escherichia albertii KF1]|nr:hypothetical protein EAKF1_ch4205 [Escherichia albertii KF1]